MIFLPQNLLLNRLIRKKQEKKGHHIQNLVKMGQHEVKIMVALLGNF